MSTDRELLELAAKAAGFKVQPKGRTDGAFLVLMNEDGDFIWNPRNNGSDSMMLACIVGLRVDFGYHTGADKRRGVAVWTPGDDSPFPPFWTMYGRNPDLDVRLTILRAAACVGMAMNSQQG
jgi:hypothetical protein